MNKKIWAGLLLVILLIVSVSIVSADETDLDGDYLWNHHQAPFDYTFGNMIDSHQRSNVNNNETKISGFIYIHDIENDYDEGIPTTEKAHCNTQSCMVGWVIKGIKIEATLVSKGPRIWLVNEDDLPKEPGYTHFHWIGLPKSPHDLQLGEIYEGFLMKRIAPAPFFWLGGPGSGGSGGSGGGGCGGHDSGGTDGCEDDHTDEGGCTDDSTHTDGGCTDGTHDDGGCSDGGSDGSHGGSEGRLVLEGVDSHSNIITSMDQLGHGGCHED